jgi:predicted GH43/DUF377 family glycosyl hydrolase
MDYILFFGLIIVSLGVSGLFVWGIWELLTVVSRTQKKYEKTRKEFAFTRNEENPILHPGKYEFEGQAVMNPAAIHDGDKTHLFYRAIGNDGVSRIGYASSEDGRNFDDRLPYPVYAHQNPQPRQNQFQKYSLAHYGSGGSWSGCEDARATMIDNRIYLTYNAFNGWDSQRVAVTSISRDDLNAKRWKWTPPTFLSPNGQRHKNWVLFPEKIFGKFALFHNLHDEDTSRVKIEYLDDLHSYDAEAKPFDSADPNALPDRPIGWHSRMRSIAAPPLKTEAGWLGFYHAMDLLNPGQYKLGAMMLDKDDPTKVIARSPVPVLSPEAHYEQNGAKPGIIYTCGATVHNDKLTLYYGASDNYVCSASVPFSQFVDKLLKQETPLLLPAHALT